jgi:CARDB
MISPAKRRFTRRQAKAALVAVVALSVVATHGPEAPPRALGISLSPDLTLSDPSYRFADSGATLELTVTVHNVGTASSAATQVASSGAGWTDGSADVGPLPPEKRGTPGGQTVTVRIPVPDGQRGSTTTFVLKVNPQQTTPESNAANDTTTLDVSVPAAPPPTTSQLPDLRLAHAGYSFGDGGKILELSAVVLNSGAAASPATQLAATAAGWTGEPAHVRALKANEQVTVGLRLDVPPDQRGTTTLFTFTLDPKHAVRESDVENDTLTLEVAVPAPPPPVKKLADFTLAGVSHRFAENGDLLILTVTVRNAGVARSEPTEVVSSAVGWDDGRAEVGALEPRQATNVSLQLPVPSAQRGTKTTFTLRVDPDGAAPEGNPDNDSLTEVVSVAGRPTHSSGGFPWLWVGIGAGAAALLAVGSAAVVGGRRRHRAEGVTGSTEIPWSPPGSTEFPWFPPPLAEPPPTQAAEPPPLEPAPARVVNTGFAGAGEPDRPFDQRTPLVCGQTYYFWLEVGPPLAESIELTPTALPEVEVATRLRVVVFDAGLATEEGENHGELLVGANGEVSVARPAARVHSATRERRLFFRVRTPASPGPAQLRCNIYHGQVLLQSRLVTAEVLARFEPGAGRLESALDYTLAPSLDPAHLSRLPAHRLSILLNKTAKGTHLLTFAGEGEFEQWAEIDQDGLQEMIELTRGAMRMAAWGKETPWVDKDPSYRYLYAGFDRERLRTDLVRFAIRGFRLYAAIANALSGGRERTDELNELMRRPGMVQIALQGSARRLLPAALFYDYFGFESNRDSLDDYTLCETFTAALEGDGPLEELGCFKGDCPARGEATVVCPSGFWGYRHSLGLPVSVDNAPDVPPEIGYVGTPRLTLAVSTDPEFVMRAGHETALRALIAAQSLDYVDSYDELLPALKAGRADVVYFYCHGGLSHDTWPYLQVGSLEDPFLTADVLFSHRVCWIEPRPLVFINGCHTTAVEPEKVVEFVSALVGDARAAGVVGTEITIFEPLATDFGLEYMRRFIAGSTVGDAVRGARLALLQKGNPLGLVYVPFALASLKMSAAAALSA